jgi:hypothetical protein
MAKYDFIETDSHVAKNDRERLSADDIARMRETRRWMRDLAAEAMAQRSKSAKFHGLEREFLHFQDSMLIEYAKTKDMKRPEELGRAREAILRNFISQNGLFPRKYGLTDVSARVVSPSGHYSKQIDMLFYDRDQAITLMRVPDVLEYYPVEVVYGVIQVKSRATKAAILDGLENLASYKALPDPRGTGHHGFGILFAYETDLEWMETVHEVESFCSKYPMTLWPNVFVILGEGILFCGEGNRAMWRNEDIERISSLQIHGRPDDGHTLLQFYDICMHLLGNSRTCAPSISQYFRLPLTAGQLSYSFSFAPVAEVGVCDKHGSYLRAIKKDELERIIQICSTEPGSSINRLLDSRWGRTDQGEEAYARDVGVKVYNPENLPVMNILFGEDGRITFDAIVVNGINIYIPYYYSETEKLIAACPKCG